MSNLIDQQQRLQALNPEQSFIVQAPAGSGKTELLVQRYLSLLAHVNNPEEILAITFTRKAAREMRDRILIALQSACDVAENNTQHQQHTQTLATQALEHARKLRWNLFENPGRLRIFTIDAFSRHLTQQMPILSNLASQLTITEEATHLYEQAVDDLFESLESDEEWVNALEKLLLHLDNDFTKAKQLFVSMLSQRDQWLPKILQAHSNYDLRETLERSLKNIGIEAVQRCQTLFPLSLLNETLDIMAYARANLNLPMISTLTHLSEWQQLANFLLTQSFTWKKRFTKNEGFLPSDRNIEIMKDRIEALITELQKHDALRESLQNILLAPAPHYTREQWQLLEALLELLPILAAKLILVFTHSGKIDFIQIAAGANQALQENEVPSDLALRLDYQIKHILIDEFQDTSQTQFRLLTALTHSWQAEDKKTLFLVGDPMQSIYLFRQAEVGLFLYAWQHGINHLSLTPLQLQVNFRSDKNIVEWFNHVFPSIFPKHEDISTGAIRYCPSVAKNSIATSQGAHFYPTIDLNRTTQAQEIIRIIKTLKLNHPSDSIAILVRNRSHLSELIHELKRAEIHFQGVDIDKLSEQHVVQDLLSLTRALLYLHDRIAWLAILRAPWCGLSLSDLHALANKQSHLPLWSALINYSLHPTLSSDAKQRLQRIVPILQQSLALRDRIDLRTWIETTWHQLGGPAAVTNEIELHYAHAFFDLLENVENNGNVDTVTWLKNRITHLYASDDTTADNPLQIMTIHKSKGLEFDHVILPALDRSSRSNTKELLMWMERTTTNDADEFIMAPITALNDEADPIYNYLRQQEKLKLHNEIKRLFYVAATRAKKSLHLFANLNTNTEPKQGSLLELIWPFYKNEFAEIRAEKLNDTTTETEILEVPLIRLKSTWEGLK